MPNRITLLKQGGMWCCQFHGDLAARVRSLFGVEVLPSSFRDVVPEAEVLWSIQLLNPGVLVEVRAC